MHPMLQSHCSPLCAKVFRASTTSPALPHRPSTTLRRRVQLLVSAAACVSVSIARNGRLRGSSIWIRERRKKSLGSSLVFVLTRGYLRLRLRSAEFSHLVFRH